MLVYLDTAHFIWVESAQREERRAFLETWRSHSCELAVSVQLLQEAVKHGTLEKLDERLRTMRSLAPMRGVSSAAGVAVREATLQIQMRELLREPRANPIGAATEKLLPRLTAIDLVDAAAESAQQLRDLNLMGVVLATLEEHRKTLAPIKQEDRVDPKAFARGVRLATAHPEVPNEWRRTGEEVIETVEQADGRRFDAMIARLGLEGARHLGRFEPVDLSKAAGFLEVARDAATDISAELEVHTKKVHELAKELNPYAAPGYSLEMAVSRARFVHNADPKSSDIVDQEHVSFAPYVDLLMVDKRTHDFLQRELRRDDDRIVEGAADSIRRPGNMEDIVEMIREAGR